MKLRIRFGKSGMMRFIGHLDMVRYFQKAFRRAGFDMKYTQGFHPHQIMSFASPLGVGLESTGEYMDIEIERPGAKGIYSDPENLTGENLKASLEQMELVLKGEMAEGVDIISIIPLRDDSKNAMSLLAGADYNIRFKEGRVPASAAELDDAIAGFLAQQEIIVTKKTKKSEKEVDLKPLIYDLRTEGDGSIFMKVSAGSAANLKPELVLNTLCSFAGFDLEEFSYIITRLEMYCLSDEEPGLISMGSSYFS